MTQGDVHYCRDHDPTGMPSVCVYCGGESSDVWWMDVGPCRKARRLRRRFDRAPGVLKVRFADELVRHAVTCPQHAFIRTCPDHVDVPWDGPYAAALAAGVGVT